MKKNNKVKIFKIILAIAVIILLVGIIIYLCHKTIPIYIDIVFLTIMFLDWYIQYKKIKESTNLRRFITGNLAGIAQISILIKLIMLIVRIII